MPIQLIPIGLWLKFPNVDHRWVYSAEALWAIYALRLAQLPASANPRMGINIAPAQIKMNCRTSLKMADRNPPSATYAATASDETMMEKFRYQPRTTFITS